MVKKIVVYTLISLLFAFLIVWNGCSTFEVVDDTPPECVIIYPNDGIDVAGVVKVVIGATDNKDVKYVDLFIDGEHVAQINQPPYEYLWDTSSLENNTEHSLYAVAYDKEDNAGFSGSVTVRLLNGDEPDELAPQVFISYPPAGCIINNNITIVANASDNVGVVKVQFFIDGLLVSTDLDEPFSYNWDISGYLNNSSHTIHAQAYDQAENIGLSSIITVTVQNQDLTPPDLTILYPVNDAQFKAGDIVNISVDARDDSGIDKVEFYIDGQLLATVTSTPYYYAWNTSGFGDGKTHTIYVKAFDAVGNYSSQLATVVVNP